MRAQILLAAVVFIAIQGCTVRVHEFPVRIGVEIDADAGFFAYTTPLRPTEPSAMKVTCRTANSINGRVSVHSPDLEYLYPVEAYRPARVYVRPEFLASQINFAVSDAPESGSIHALGYFELEILKANYPEPYMVEIEESEAGGLKWAVVGPRTVDKLRKALSQITIFAAEYGADEICDVSVFYTPLHVVNKKPGIYVYAKAVAYEAGE